MGQVCPRAREGIRTPDLLITSELLCRLSYPGETSQRSRTTALDLQGEHDSGHAWLR